LTTRESAPEPCPDEDADARKARGVWAAAPRVFALCLGLTLVVWLSGAMRSPEHVGIWLAQALLGGAAGLAASRWLVPIDWFDQRLRAAIVLIALAVTLPVSVIAFVSNVMIGSRASWEMAVEILPSAFGISLVMTALAVLMRPHSAQTHAAAAGAPPPKFLARLPPKLAGAELYAVEAEDHYLRLHTSQGHDLILMRLSDAIAELEGLEGAQTHRSWWVAKAAVAEAERGDGRAVLTLKDGSEAPVSRGFARELRAAGWF
jgi:LytTr DNA-binding domain-containing protein